MKTLFVVLVLAFGLGCGDDSKTSPGLREIPEDMAPDVEPDVPDMTVEPDLPRGPQKMAVDVEELVFERVEIGQTRTLKFVVTNLGESDLVLQSATVSQINRVSNPEFKAGAKWIGGTTIVEPQTFREFEVVYEPSDHESDRGLVTLLSNDPTLNVVTVRLETVNFYADLDAPQLLKFGTVPAQTSQTRRVEVYNRGAAPLTLNSIVTSGNGPFTVAFLPTEGLPRVIQRNELYVFDVIYSPNNNNTHRGTVTINSNDPDEAMLPIAVSGNDPTACLQAIPEVVDFGEIPARQKKTLRYTLFNCSSMLPLTVSKIEIIYGGHIFGLEGVPELPLTLNGFETATFDVAAEIPMGEGLGQMAIENNDTDRIIELRARTPEN